jgi:long-chain fatty acid transport protein
LGYTISMYTNARIAGTLALGLGAASLPAIVLAASPAFTGLAAVADDAEGALTNPAGMTRLDRPTTSLGALLAQGFGSFEVDEQQTTVDGGDPDNSNDPIAVPSAYYVHPIDDRWRVGISLTVPSGFGSDNGGSWAGRYYSDSYSLVYVALTPAVAWRVDEHWSVGLGVGINYTLSNSEVAVNTLLPSRPDGRLEADLDGVGFNYTASVLWEPSPQTRFGLVYTSSSEADLDGTLHLRNAGPVIDAIGLNRLDVEIRNRLPQRVLAGVYHELDERWSVTADVMWVDFSEFGTAGVALNGRDLSIDASGIYDDVWFASLGVGRQLDPLWKFEAGVFYVSQPVSDADRTLSMRLDSIVGLGAGAHRALDNGDGLDFSLTLVDYGEAPVDTGPSLLRGRVVGSNSNPYALLLGVAWHF